MTNWEEVKSDSKVWDWKEHPTLEATLKRKEPGTYGINYLVTTEDGEEHLVFTKTVIASKMLMVEEGDMFKLVCLGEKKSESGRTYTDFALYRPSSEDTGETD
jgi:hypothetical protein